MHNYAPRLQQLSTIYAAKKKTKNQLKFLLTQTVAASITQNLHAFLSSTYQQTINASNWRDKASN